MPFENQPGRPALSKMRVGAGVGEYFGVEISSHVVNIPPVLPAEASPRACGWRSNEPFAMLLAAVEGDLLPACLGALL